MELTRPRIFISYAHKDRKYCEELLEHLGWLRHSGEIIPFDDSKIHLGDEWRLRIEEELGKADIVIFLVSPSFVGSYFCIVNEMLPVLSGNARIVPVLIRPVDIEALPLNKYQALPHDALQSLKAVSCWHGQPGRDQAWTQVSKGLRQVIQTTLRPASLSQDMSCLQVIPIQNSNEDIVAREWLIGETTFRVSLPKEIANRPTIDALIELEIAPFKEFALTKDTLNSYHRNHVDARFEIVARNNRVISLVSYVVNYFGGAHHNYDYVSINMDLENTKKINLSDLLDFDRYRPLVISLLARDLQRQKMAHCAGESYIGDSIEDLIGAGGDLVWSFYHDKDNTSSTGIRVLFSPYDVGSFAEGPYEVDLQTHHLREAATQDLFDLIGQSTDTRSGVYRRKNENEKSEITITETDNPTLFKVTGYAFWGTDREVGPNIGELEFVAPLEANTIRYFSNEKLHKDHCVQITFVQKNKLIVREEGWSGVHGMNVTFEGEYEKVAIY